MSVGRSRMVASRRWLFGVFYVGMSLIAVSPGTTLGAESASDVIPHHQTVPPGPALSPAEAIRKMEVPPGFHVELVASEPDVVNPVAMTIDGRGRFWITESFEYPRESAGPGRDRIKILEDTDRDGDVDKVTIFAEGLNIPSGIAVGHGGVWVANSPDILFLRDTDGDDRADTREVVVSGFGRTDTHELPNSLTWGPDGWLYGLNGVFNYSHVFHQGHDWKFTCAVFRIHPRTREFQLFAEGTSNPWGIAFDPEGQLFISACVIDHLWHLAESGYYHRQGGPYPPYTWKLESIVDYTHQMAAYCGITYFDSPAFPAEYRDRLYMGNIHGGCINVDQVKRDGSSYVGEKRPDFLTANDAWFMPVVQKVGPDGSLYILDWYDRYHCYQDANRDPEGIDRGRGRLYRVRFEQTPRAPAFDLDSASDEELIASLANENIYFRETAQRILSERRSAAALLRLQEIVLDDAAPMKQRRHALWTIMSSGAMPTKFAEKLLQHPNASWRAGAVRALGNDGKVTPRIDELLHQLTRDPSPDVRLQLIVAARKLQGVNSWRWLCEILQASGDDAVIPHIVWQNLQPQLETHSEEFARFVAATESPSAGFARLLPHAVQRVNDLPSQQATLAALVTHVVRGGNWSSAEECLETLANAWMEREIPTDPADAWHTKLLPALKSQEQTNTSLAQQKQLTAALLGDADARRALQRVVADKSVSLAIRQRAMATLGALQDPYLIELATTSLRPQAAIDDETLSSLFDAMGRLRTPDVADVLLQSFAQVSDNARPRVIELLTQRPEWALALLQHIESQKVPREAVHINQARRLQNSSSVPVRDAVARIWGRVREDRNPDVELAVEQVRKLWNTTTGDAVRGQAVFQKTCAQCHQIYGQGEQVGPDITRNGRASFDQLLSNVFDPNLVVGAAYQAHTVITQDGRTLSGLLVERNEQRVVLKVQGGKTETIDADQIESLVVSPLSLMPEGWEKQLAPQDLADLLHYITLDGPPTNAESRYLPGTPAPPKN